MHESDRPAATAKVQGLFATYATGFFSLSLVPMTSLVVPLWALQIGASPSIIGLIVASRALLPFFLSIHGGAMMDRLGTRRMLLIFSLVSAVLSFCYPLSTSIWVLIGLQLIVGLTQGMCWMAAQIKIAKLSAGRATYAGRFTFITTCGTALGPLLVGAAWDAAGAWGAFTVVGVWSGFLLLASLALPAHRDRPAVPLHWGALLPEPADYWRAFALMRVPAVALIVAATFLWISVLSIQGSFYTVYLKGIGLSGTFIGLLVGLQALIGGPASLLTGAAEKVVPAHWLLLLSVAVAIVSMAVTPLFDTFIPLLLAACIFGVGIGFGFPLLLSMLSHDRTGDNQGLKVGLRTTANRLASVVTPMAMGMVVELVGIRNGFLVIGLAMFVMLLAVGWAVHRSPAFRRKDP